MPTWTKIALGALVVMVLVALVLLYGAGLLGNAAVA